MYFEPFFQGIEVKEELWHERCVLLTSKAILANVYGVFAINSAVVFYLNHNHQLYFRNYRKGLPSESKNDNIYEKLLLS